MKKAISLIACIVVYLNSLGQPKTLSGVVNLKLPSAAQKLTKEQAKSYAEKNFKNSEITSLKTENFYTMDGQLLAFWDTKVALTNKKSLSAIKAEALELYKLDQNIIVDDASIKNINGHAFLVINYHKGSTNYYRFISDYGNNQTAVNGLVQSEYSVKSKSKVALDEIMDSITFK